MKHLKLGILVCGAVLLAMLLAGQMVGSFVDLLKADPANTIIVLVGLAVPTAVAALGLAKPPFLQWQAIVATAGFALVVVKMRLWQTLPHIADMNAKAIVAHVALVLGLVLSILSIAKPEAAV
jgi:hypothetical protein